MKDNKSISYKVADKLIRELRSKNYRVSPVNLSEKTDNRDIEKICVTKEGRDLCSRHWRNVNGKRMRDELRNR